MKLTQEFTVDQPADVVWEFFDDLPTVAQCMPGAELDDVRPDGTCRGKVTVKLGPMRASFDGEATVRRDHSSRTGSIKGRGMDRQGGSRAQIDVEYRVQETDGAGTRVTVDADVNLTGSAAQFARSGIIEETSNQLTGEFVRCLEAKLSAGVTGGDASSIKAQDLKGFQLLRRSVVARVKALFRKLFRRG